MKTNKQNKQEKKNSEELQSRSEQSSRTETAKTVNPISPISPISPMTPMTSENPSPRSPLGGRPPGPLRSPVCKPFVNFAERDYNRQLPLDKVLAALKRWMPRQYELAEVVGEWIWITFPEQPIERVRADLSQLGFHWNNTRKCWQHPCGATLPRGQQEPREKYTCYMASAARTPASSGRIEPKPAA